MTSVDKQKEMFYNARRLSTKQALSNFIKERETTRFKLVKRLREEGKLDTDWFIVEKFDKDTDSQIEILDKL